VSGGIPRHLCRIITERQPICTPAVSRKYADLRTCPPSKSSPTVTWHIRRRQIEGSLLLSGSAIASKQSRSSSGSLERNGAGRIFGPRTSRTTGCISTISTGYAPVVRRFHLVAAHARRLLLEPLKHFGESFAGGLVIRVVCHALPLFRTSTGAQCRLSDRRVICGLRAECSADLAHSKGQPHLAHPRQLIQCGLQRPLPMRPPFTAWGHQPIDRQDRQDLFPGHFALLVSKASRPELIQMKLPPQRQGQPAVPERPATPQGSLACEGWAKSPHEAYFIYWSQALEAVRLGRWKLHFPHEHRTLGGRKGGTNGRPVPYQEATAGLSLFDLENDVGETKDLNDQHPEIVAAIEKLADQMREDLGDSARHMTGSGRRSAGRLEKGDKRFIVKDGQQTLAEPP
jgi:hypothetical protein